MIKHVFLVIFTYDLLMSFRDSVILVLVKIKSVSEQLMLVSS